MKSEVKYEFKIKHWANTDELCAQLNEYTNNEWQADSHRLDGAENKGWTIYKKVDYNNPILQERRISVGKVYEILNKLVEAGSDLARSVDKEIKKAAGWPGCQDE